MKRYISILICLLTSLALSQRKKHKIHFNGQVQQQFHTIYKYFYDQPKGYYLELGGYNPLQLRNTLLFNNWRGIIVQANQDRANNLNNFVYNNVMVLNFALTKESGTKIKFFEHKYVGRSSIKQQLKQDPQFVNGITNVYQVMTISLADLCHKYYKTRPIFMSIDIEGVGQTVLQSNDWTNDKCIPDLIYAQVWPKDHIKAHNSQGIITQLRKHNYTVLDYVSINQMFVHQSKVDFYRNKGNLYYQKIRNNLNVISWQIFCPIVLTKLIDKPCDSFFQVKSGPFYLFLHQPRYINIQDINDFSNEMSNIGINRPIVILEYDQKISKILLPDQNYTISDVKINQFNFKKIKTYINNKELIVYVFDNQFYQQLNVIIQTYQSNTSDKNTLNVKKQSNQKINVEDILQRIQKVNKDDNTRNQLIQKMYKQLRQQKAQKVNKEGNKQDNKEDNKEDNENNNFSVLLIITILIIGLLILILMRMQKLIKKMGFLMINQKYQSQMDSQMSHS